jgi:hypothetical protein
VARDDPTRVMVSFGPYALAFAKLFMPWTWQRYFHWNVEPVTRWIRAGTGLPSHLLPAE